MVLGISLRGKSKKKEEGTIKASPSLPSVLPQGIPWPENLVDINEVKAARKDSRDEKRANKEKNNGGRFTPSISFHRPFRVGTPDGTGSGGGIASLFTSRVSTGGGFVRTGTVSQSRSQRRKVAPTLNIMIAGAQGTGKTSLLKLFLDTSIISPAATAEQKQSVETFLAASRKVTKELRTACVEIAENRFDRVLLTLIDTPGLDFTEGKELRLERDVTSLVKYLDLQYDETMGEESKVVRQNKGDQHVHLCIYLVDPNSITTATARRNKSQVGHGNSTTSDDNDASDVESDDDEESSSGLPLSMNPAEIRVIKRLAARVNVLPVIARTDALTESRLRAVKRTVRKDLDGAGIGFGLFETSTSHARASKNSGSKTPTPGAPEPNGRRATVDEANDEASPSEEAVGEDDDEDRKARPVIRIRSRKSFTGTERSQSRRRRSAFDGSPERSDGDEGQPPLPDGEAGAQMRLTRATLDSLLPFALVSPQPASRRRHPPKAAHPEGGELQSPTSEAEQDAIANGAANGDLLTPSPELEPQTPASVTNRRSWGSVPPSAFPASYQTPQNVQALAAAAASEYGSSRTFPRGQFTRKYKWGTLDVLDPAHCDFVALRTAVLSTHFRGLKVNTREVLYEKYRTEKLLARRATRNIGGEERKRLLQDLGL